MWSPWSCGLAFTKGSVRSCCCVLGRWHVSVMPPVSWRWEHRENRTNTCPIPVVFSLAEKLKLSYVCFQQCPSPRQFWRPAWEFNVWPHARGFCMCLLEIHRVWISQRQKVEYSDPCLFYELLALASFPPTGKGQFGYRREEIRMWRASLGLSLKRHAGLLGCPMGLLSPPEPRGSPSRMTALTSGLW